MRRVPQIFLMLIAPIVLSGCVAAVIPVVAAGVLGKRQIDKRQTTRPQPLIVAKSALEVNVAATLGFNEATPAAPPALPVPTLIDPVIVTETSAFIAFALDKNARRIAGESISSALLMNKVDIFKPRFLPCDDRPLAIIIDLDDSIKPSGIDAPVSMLAGLDKLRAAKIDIIWLSQRGESARGDVTTQMRQLGLPIGINDSLILSRGRGDRKQQQRLDAALGRCVVALMGDEKPDFDELFEFLRNADDALALDPLWNNGWFITDSSQHMKVELDALDP